MTEKMYKIGMAFILFGIYCSLQNSEYYIIQLMEVCLPWIGIILIGISFWKDL